MIEKRRKLLAGAVLACVLGSGGAALGASASSWSDFWDRWKQGVNSTGAERDSSQPGGRPAVVGVRGWSKDAASKDTDRRDYPAVDKLDRFRVQDKDLERFIREGRLAP